MKMFKLKINWETKIQAETEEEAYETFWENIESNNETAETFLTDKIEIEEIK